MARYEHLPIYRAAFDLAVLGGLTLQHLLCSPVGTNPFGVAFDGANIWVVNFSDSNITKLRASDGANLGTFPVGSFPQGVAFEGANIWVVNQGSNSVTKY